MQYFLCECKAKQNVHLFFYKIPSHPTLIPFYRSQRLDGKPHDSIIYIIFIHVLTQIFGNALALFIYRFVDRFPIIIHV